jgi:hypothetical protein
MWTSAASVALTPTEKKFSCGRARERLRVGMRLLAVVSVACAARTASAERAIAVDVQGAPFAAAELVDALRMRLAHDGKPIRVRVTADPRGVRVEAHGGSRAVALDGLSGAAAARLVALVADDLLLDDLAPAPVPVRHAERTIEATAQLADWPGAMTTGVVELVTPVAGPMSIGVGVGGGALATGNLALDAGVVRLDACLRRGWLDVRAGALAEPIFVTTGKGDTTVELGGGASVRARLPIADRVRGVVAVGVDAFATQTHYSASGLSPTATPWLAAWLGLGVEVAL